MAITDIFTGVGIAATVVSVGVSAWALWRWHRRLRAYRAFQELDADLINDIRAYPFLRLQADELAAEAKAARDTHKVSKVLSESAMEARAKQLACEQRLRAAGYEIVCGEVA